MVKIKRVEVAARHTHCTELRVECEVRGAEVNVITELAEGNSIPNTRFIGEDLLLPAEVAGPDFEPGEEFILKLHEALDDGYAEFMADEMERICG